MSSYRNKVVVISGASAGVGRATAVEFARQGASVALLARGQAGLEGARAEVEAAGGRAWTCILDVADAQAVDEAAARIEAELGPIQVWVNNAMVTVLAPVAEMTAEEYRRVTEVTYLGTVHGTCAALRHMRPRNRGVIIQVGSALAYRAIPLQSAYCAALVGRNGSIDWFCPPRFDAPACFSKLLGSDEHGFWQIAPQQPPQRIERHYQQDTLVLCTEFHSQGGRVRLTDYMPVGDASLIVRCVEGLEGRQQMRMQLAPRFGYGARPPRCEPHADGCSLWDADGQRLILRSDLPLQLDPDQASASFQIAAGQRLYFVLQHLQADEQPAVLEDMQKLLHDCRHWWRSWVSQSTYQGRWRDAVIRSLITLKALTYLPTGSMVAAPTTSLPEAPGRSANWDYRFCWIRDAVWALDILIDSNYLEEAHAWRDWLLRLMSRDSDLRVLYDLDGQNSPQERQLDWLRGHLDSRPVRSGNAARDQHQLDVYGQLIDLLHIGRRSGLRPSQQTWYRQRRLVDKVIACWHQPDEGIWELRGRRRHYIHSKVYAWVALDRSIRDAEQFKLHAPLAHWRRVRDEIHAQVCERGVDPQRGVFKQSYEDAEPDASVLMIPLLGFLPVEDPRVQATIDWIQQELQRNSLVYRFRPHRSEAGWEGSFIACSFWMVDNLIMSQRQEQAEAQFARLLALRNDVGLLAEQYHPQYGLLGNFPQALSHLALVKSAYLIQACEKVHHGGAPERHSYRPLD